MISNRNGEKTTPKFRACELLADLLDDVGVDCLDPDASERERGLVNAQVSKLKARMYRMLKQTPAVEVADEEVVESNDVDEEDFDRTGYDPE